MVDKYSSTKIVYKTLGTGKLDLIGIDIPCAVIEGPERKPVRLLSRRKLGRTLLNHKERHEAYDAEVKDGLPRFLTTQNLEGYRSQSLAGLFAPLWYKEPHRGLLSAGYRAELLPEICGVFIRAAMDGVLTPEQMCIARRCQDIQEAYAKVGIIALVDEATGYQEQRERDALQKLITLYLADVPLPWVSTFPREFYQEAYRLHCLRYTPGNTQHPPIIGAFTKKAIYECLPPAVYEELCTRNPRVHGPASSWRQRKHHQHLTDDMGRQQIVHRLGLVLHLMRAANGNPSVFWSLMDGGRAQAQVPMPFLLVEE